MNKLVRFDHLGTARFLTISTYHRHRVLTDETVIRLFLRELDRMRSKFGVGIHGYVVMPEHVHLVLLPPESLVLSRAIGELKSLSGRAILSFFTEHTTRPVDQLRFIKDGTTRLALWQRRYYDHNCRTMDVVKEKIAYCHKNPVTRGLAATPEECPWSSYRALQGMSNFPLRVDAFSL